MRQSSAELAGVYPAMTAGHTFTNAPLACAAGIATIEAIEEERLLPRVTAQGAWLEGEDHAGYSELLRVPVVRP